MDTKRLLTSVLIAGALMLLFSYFFRGGNAGAGAGAVGAGAAGAANPLYVGLQDFRDTPLARRAHEGDAAPGTQALGSLDPASSDKFSLTVNNVTAGLDRVEFNPKEYTETVKGKIPLTLIQAVPGLGKPFSTLDIHIEKMLFDTEGKPQLGPDGKPLWSPMPHPSILNAQYVWKFTRITPTDIDLTMTFMEPDPAAATVPATNPEGAPPQRRRIVAEVVKTFHLEPNLYEITITHKITNKLADQPLRVSVDQLTAPSLWRDDPRTDDRLYHAEALDSAKKLLADNRFNTTQVELAKVVGGTREIGQFNDYSANPFVWAASANRFFALIVRPLPEVTPPTTLPIGSGTQVISESHHVAMGNLDIMLGSAKPGEIVSMIRLTGAPQVIGPGQSSSQPLSVYMGPKQRDTFQGLASAAGRKEYVDYDYFKIMQFSQRGCWLYSFCVFDNLVLGILWLLDFLKRTVAFGNYGVAIMILVVLVRAALHPLTRASQINMAKMGKKMKDIQPKLEAMKRKYPDNKPKQSEETMRIYKENNVNPAASIMGCLPMLLQMPIWAALFSGLALDIDLRHACFIPGWINDLSNPDTIWPQTPAVLGHPLFTIPFINFEIYGLNPLPIFLAVVLFINMKVTMATQPKPADDQQAQMQKMSQYSIFILPFFLYNASSGSNLYFFASTMAGLVDTYFIRKSLKRQGILPATAAALPTHAADEETK